MNLRVREDIVARGRVGGDVFEVAVGVSGFAADTSTVYSL